VYSAQASDVRDVIVAGTPRMLDRKILGVSEAEILREADRWAERIASEFLRGGAPVPMKFR
jgi:hypothetical protein